LALSLFAVTRTLMKPETLPLISFCSKLQQTLS
jgi:hypothetical protein